jgi:hypothetical protein
MGYKAQWNSLGLTTVARFAFTGSEATRHGEAQHPFCDGVSVEDGFGRRLLVALVINLQPFSNMAGLGHYAAVLCVQTSAMRQRLVLWFLAGG